MSARRYQLGGPPLPTADGAGEHDRCQEVHQPAPWLQRHVSATVDSLSGDSCVVAVLEARSFRVLLDDSRVDKDGTLDGTYIPSLALFGGHRPLAFLDGVDPRHAALKRCGPELHARLATEVCAVVPPPGTTITLSDVEKMPLVKSFVWETLRMNPPVEFQYGRARRDTVVESHDAAYEVKKGEMVFGYQPLATRDERVFQRGREFVPDRFAVCSDDDERRRMLEHVVWSNGPETGAAAEGNKQCPGKDAVVAVGRLMVAEVLPQERSHRSVAQERAPGEFDFKFQTEVS